MIGGSSVETGDTGVTLFRCFANARRNARVRRSRCLAPPSRGARKSATRSGFSVLRFSPGSLTSANTATSSSLGTPRKTASAVSTAAVAVASEEPGSIAMTVAPTTPPARAVATWKKASPEMFVASARLSFITSARGSEGSAALCAACTETFRPERACLVSLSVSPSGSSQRTPSVTCAPPPTHGETRRTTGGRCPAIWLSATHAPTDTSASTFARAGAASADAVTARHQSVSARIACRATTAGSCSVRVEFASETRDRDGTAPRGVTPRRGVVALSSGGITGSSPAANAMCVATRSRRRASKGRRLGRGDEALSERTSLVRGRFGKKRDFSRELEVMLGSRARNPRRRVRPSSFARVCAVVSVRENPRFRNKRFSPISRFVHASSVREKCRTRLKKLKKNALLTVDTIHRSRRELFSGWTARRVRKRTTPRASTVDAVGISDESRRRSCLDKPRASRDRLVSAGTTGPQLPPHPTRSCASHDGEPRALGGPRGGRRPPGRRAPRDRRPRLLGRALAPRRCAHDRARRRRQDGASFPRYRARPGANARSDPKASQTLNRESTSKMWADVGRRLVDPSPAPRPIVRARHPDS